MKRKSILTIICAVAVIGVAVWHCSDKERQASYAMKFFQDAQNKSECFSVKNKGLDSIYSNYPAERICFINDDNGFNPEECAEDIIYITKNDSIRKQLIQNGRMSLYLPEAMSPYVMDEQSSYLLCNVESVHKQGEQNVYKLRKVER